MTNWLIDSAAMNGYEPEVSCGVDLVPCNEQSTRLTEGIPGDGILAH